MSAADGGTIKRHLGFPKVDCGNRNAQTVHSYEDNTMIRFFSALAIFGAISLGSANAADQSLKLADAAPNQYVVVPGDTLWDISARFLSEPWRWPEIWRMNQAQIKNPHRIYPGDVIFLEHDANGKPLLRLAKGNGNKDNGKRLESKQHPQIYTEPLSEAIPPIPPSEIDPFLATPLFVEENTLQSAPRIVATQENRVILGKGDTAYVEGADPAQKQWQIFRRGRALYDPEYPQRILGYEAFHLGSATQVRLGNPAVFEVNEAKQEIGYGDRLAPTDRPELVDYVPHPPEQEIEGRVVSAYGGIGSSGGRLSIILINRGSEDGLEIGHVLAIERIRTVVQRGENDQQENVVIPPTRFGLIFVFRTFEHVSYALVLQADGLIEVNDRIRTP
jgi:hypothetical protein